MERRCLLALMAAGLAGCGTPSPSLTIRGQLVADVPITLPPDGLMVVELRDATADRVLTEQRQPLRGLQSPLPFQLQLPREQLQPSHRLEVRGALLSQGWAQWLSAAGGHRRFGLGHRRGHAAPAACGTAAGLPVADRLRHAPLHRSACTATRCACSTAIRPTTCARCRSLRASRLEAVGDPATFVQTEGRQARVGVRGVVYGDCSVSR